MKVYDKPQHALILRPRGIHYSEVGLRYFVGYELGHSTDPRSTDVTFTDLVSAKRQTKEVYCFDIVVLIVLF